MSKVRRALLVFIVILIQSAVAISAGVAAIYLSAESAMPPGISVGGVDIGGLGRAEAEDKLNEHFSSGDGLTKLVLDVEQGGEYIIPYSDIEAGIDSKATMEFMHGWKAAGYLPNLLEAYFGGDRLSVVPVVRFNEGRLREKLIQLAKEIDREPVNASIDLDNGKLVRKAEIPGRSLNVANAVEAIRRQLAGNPNAPVLLSESSNYEIQAVPAEIRLKDMDDIQQVLAEYSTDVLEPELMESVKLSAKAINGIILPASGSGDGNGIFSFVEWLKKQDPSFENDNEGYDQVASTLYAAVLSAGIGKDGITRLPHALAVEYIEPGLDAWISGNSGDLKFANTFSHKLAIFAGVNGSRLTVSIAGALSDRKGGVAISTEIVQKFNPPVVNVENKDLKPGEKVVLSPGRKGVTVKVYRNEELVSTDKYEAVKSIVQIGPNTGWSEDEK